MSLVRFLQTHREMLTLTTRATYQIEKLAEKMLKKKSVKGSQGQRELYDIKDEELFDIVNDIAEVAKDCHNINIIEFSFYKDNIPTRYTLDSTSSFENLFEV